MAQLEQVPIQNGCQSVMLREPRPFRPFKSSEEYLYAMKEDLAEWLNMLYPDLEINVDNFMDKLESGVVLCQHANNVRRTAEEYKLKRPGKKFSTQWDIPEKEVHYRSDVKQKTFFARDNVSNFISWCRLLGIYECLLFETDDLILRKNEKHVILCLLEVARRGARYGMLAPMLVQFEREIDREIAKEQKKEQRALGRANSIPGSEDADVEDDDDEEEEEEYLVEYGPMPQIITNDLKSLDEMVRDLVERCSCPTQFPMIRVSEGKYRIGDTKVLIFVRILRNHVMVRVGGGWDTLAHYLDKHDPCRCKSGHRSTISSKLVSKSGELGSAQVVYERSPASPPRTRRSSTSSISSGGRKSSVLSDSSEVGGSTLTTPGNKSRNRSRSPAARRVSIATPAIRPLVGPGIGYGGYVSSGASSGLDSLSSTESGPARSTPTDQAGSCDSSSEVSDEGYRSNCGNRGSVKAAGKKLSRTAENAVEDGDITERPESSLTHASSDCSSTMSTDEVRGEETPTDPAPEKMNVAWNGRPDLLEITPAGGLSGIGAPGIKLDNADATEGVDNEDSSIVNGNDPSVTMMSPKKSRIPASRSPRRPLDSFDNRDNIVANSRNEGGPNVNAAPRRKYTQCAASSPSAANVTPGKIVPRMPRSRSSSSDNGVYGFLADTSPRQSRIYSSLRVSDSRARAQKNSTGKGTWSGRQRERPGLSADTFKNNNERALSSSPRPRRSVPGSFSSHSTPSRTPAHKTSLPASLQTSPTKQVSPLLQKILQENELDNDAKILQKMKEIIDNYAAIVEKKLSNEEMPPSELADDFTSAWVHGNGTVNGIHDEGAEAKSSQGKLLPNPRKDTQPGSSSKIPAPTFFRTTEPCL